MKKKNWLIAAIITLNIIGASAQNLFEKLGNNELITSIYVSKSLLNMFPSMADKANVDGIDIKNIANKLEQIDIYNSDNKEGMQLIRTEVKKLQSSNKSYEILMKIKDGNEDVIFFAEKDKNNTFKSLVMFVDEQAECSLIRLLGNFTAKDLQEITKK